VLLEGGRHRGELLAKRSRPAVNRSAMSPILSVRAWIWMVWAAI